MIKREYKARGRIIIVNRVYGQQSEHKVYYVASYVCE